MRRTLLAVLANRAFVAEAKAAGAVPLIFGMERSDGSISRFDTVAFPEGHPRAAANPAGRKSPMRPAMRETP